MLPKLPQSLILIVLLLAPGLAGADSLLPGNVLPVTFDKEDARYWEGDTVRLTISQSAAQTATRVRVFCESGCPDSTVYEAPLVSQLSFPSPPFCQLVNGARDCTNSPTALARHEPRWNGTWAVTLNDAAGLEVYRARFNVDMTDAWATSWSVEPTETIEVVAGGFIASTFATVSFGRYDGPLKETAFRNVTALANGAGQVKTSWTVPKEEARRFANCQQAYCSKYFVRATADPTSGNTKTHEKVFFHLRPATIEPIITVGPDLGEGDVTYERTETIPLRFNLLYPNGRFALPEDIGTPSAQGLRVVVQRLDPESEAVLGTVTTILPTYLTGGLWAANWTIPRDLALKTPQGKAYEFRLLVPSTRDLHGNTIAENVTAPFTVDPARLEARFADQPLELERAEPGAWVLEPTYHDGRPFDNTVNQTWLRGHLVRATAQGDVPVPGGEVRATYRGDGLWGFDYKFPVGYASLGAHAFAFDGGTVLANDTWGNWIESNRSRTFDVVPAIPRVTLTEKAGLLLLNETTGWTRGQALTLTALVTYPDGSAYNGTRHHEKTWLNATLVKRRGESEVTETTVLAFRAKDIIGNWEARLPLTLTDAETPAGDWTLTFPLRDKENPANQGSRTFDRTVRPAPITVDGRPLERYHLLLGETVEWRFSLDYPGGEEVTPDEVPLLTVDAYRWSGERLLGVEAAQIAATWQPDRTWEVLWTPPRGVRLGEFVFIPVGYDTFGNPILATPSEPFRVSVPTIERQILVQPPRTAVRNETVYVVFDGLPGDVAENETGGPTISLERWNGRRWVVEAEDVRASSAGGDHHGAWLASAQASLGTYRFVFHGRDAQRAYVNGTSAPFDLLPLSSSRAVLAQPPAEVAKGAPAYFLVGRQPTDQVESVWVLYHGERIYRVTSTSPTPLSFNFTWTPHYKLPGGNYSFEVVGRDVYGNDLRVVSRPFAVRDIVHKTEILEAPTAVVSRGGDVRFTYRAYLPDETLVSTTYGAAIVVLERDGVAVLETAGKFLSPNWNVEAEIPLDAATGAYRFRITGTDDFGNIYREITTPEFTVVAGLVERDFQTNPKSGSRLSRIVAAAAANATDTGVDCRGAYLGASIPPTADKRALPPVATFEIEIDWKPERGAYELAWTPPRDASLGWYRLDCEGSDAEGNRVVQRSQPFQLSTVPITPNIVRQGSSGQNDFAPAATLTWRFHLDYKSAEKTPFLPEHGLPSALLRLDGTSVDPPPTIEHDGTTWVARWTAPEVLPPGRYTLIIAGRDPWGNAVSAVTLADYQIAPTLGERLFGIPGFDRAVPGVDGALLLLGLVAVAALLGSRRLRR